ncbi:MAG: accessory gene regulator ArgB-like protein [Peptostreptococcaceae bacterium]
MFKDLSYKITDELVMNEIIEKDDFEIYRYGFEALIYFIVNISVALTIGIIFNRVIHTIIFLSCYCTLRQFTGGYHAKNYLECTLTFVAIYLITILIANNIDVDRDKYLLIVMLTISIFIIYKLAPLDNRNKPLSDNEKIHYKKVAMKIATVISMIVVVCIVSNIFMKYIIYSIFAITWIAILLIIGVYANNR